jgi:hypothetical protein
MSKANGSSKLAEILGTAKPDEQAARVAQLLQAPVVDLIIRYDGRADRCDVVVLGGNLHVEMAYKLLERAREEIHKIEIRELTAKGEQGSRGAGEQIDTEKEER